MLFRRYNESSLDRLEREANDDFRLLRDLGPEHFSNAHLLDLREELRQRLDRFDRTVKMLMVGGVASVAWFVGGLGFSFLEWRLLSAACYSFSGLFMLGLLVGTWWLKWKYESRGELMYTLLQVEEELRNRAALKGRGAPSR
ncbi:MAG: hypothetical protein RMJ33_08620 [Saprospiraceae bacterium]|nr:hypothetical protein [Saprospiraceae bacterium]MDW8229886.1 hypothetical protein [Saprospiraceae bacterium]